MKKRITPTAMKLMVELYIEAINKAKKKQVWQQHTGRGLSGPTPTISTKVPPPSGREIIFFDFKKEG